MRRNFVAAAIVAFATTVSASALAQQSGDQIQALKAEIEALKAGQTAIRKDLAEIRKLLIRSRALSKVARRRPAIETVDLQLTLTGYPSKGAPDAKVTLVEFSDFQCPYCRRHTMTTLPQIERDFIETGKIRCVVRDFPIKSSHPYAFKAAEAAHCADDQEKYWAMHDRLFANPKLLGPAHLSTHAKALQLDLAKFKECIGNGKYVAKIRRSLSEGVKAGVNATPIFFLGVVDGKDGKIKIVRRIRGARSYSTFRKAINDLLSSKS